MISFNKSVLIAATLLICVVVASLSSSSSFFALPKSKHQSWVSSPTTPHGAVPLPPPLPTPNTASKATTSSGSKCLESVSSPSLGTQPKPNSAPSPPKSTASCSLVVVSTAPSWTNTPTKFLKSCQWLLSGTAKATSSSSGAPAKASRSSPLPPPATPTLLSVPIKECTPR